MPGRCEASATQDTVGPMRVVVDASDTMASLGEVADRSFDLDAWGECSQAATLAEALTRSRGARALRPTP